MLLRILQIRYHVLPENGRIFLDDILPINEREQHKIPIKHFYENDILKYGGAVDW